MKLTSKLAMAQIKVNRNRTAWTLLGIILCVSMVTAVCGFAASFLESYKVLNGGEPSEDVTSVMISLSAILSVIIAVASIVVISNAFRVSAGERTQQFGILKSVGATKRQISSIIMYECRFFCAAGIPLGVIIGLLVQFVGLMIANSIIGEINEVIHPPLIVDFFVSPWALLAAVGVSLVTVTISAWLPARKASRISAIDAIRRKADVKLKRNQVKTSAIVRALFKFEGTLASKSLKRSRRNFRATVVSLTISIIMLMAAAALQMFLTKVSNMALVGFEATAMVSYYSGSSGKWIDAELSEEARNQLLEYDGADIYGIGYSSNYNITVDNAEYTGGFMAVDDYHYREICEQANVPYGSSIILNVRREVQGEKNIETYPYADLVGKTLNFAPIEGFEGEKFTLTPETAMIDIPAQLLTALELESLCIIVPPRSAPEYSWLVLAEDSASFILHAEDIAEELIAPQLGGVIQFLDINAQTRTAMQMYNLIMLFVYGFVAMLTLIGLTNVISTISANMRLRAGEFAVLTSVGMDRRGLNRMLTLESILCSIRSLIIGIPLGLLAAWLVFASITEGDYSFPFEVPWFALIICVIGVFIVTFVSMRFSAAKLRNGSVVETIRSSDGV